jgi:transcriptional regulator with XRE-family HTH domain
MRQEKLNVLNNKIIGRNISLYRKIRGVKISHIASILGIEEANYLLYEKGQAPLTIDIIQQISEILKVDPITLLAIHPNFYIENGNHSSNVGIANSGGYYYNQTFNEQHAEMMLKLMDNVMAISDRVFSMVDKKMA